MSQVDWSFLTSDAGPGPASSWNYILEGKPGTGKSTFACGIPDTILISADPDAARGVPNRRAHFEYCSTWDHFAKVNQMLLLDAQQNKEKRRFKGVIVDTLGQFMDMLAYDQWCKLNGVKEVEGFDWGKLAKFTMGYLRAWNRAGYPWIVTSHQITKVINTGKAERVVTEPVLPASIQKLLDQECGMYLTFSWEDVTKDANGKDLPRVQWGSRIKVESKPTKKSSLSGAKTRVWLPESFNIPLLGGWDHYVTEVYEPAVERMKQAAA